MRNTWIVGSRRAVARSVRRILTTAPSAFAPIVAIAVISTLALAGFAPQAAAATQIHLDHWANGGSPQTATHWVDGNLHWTNSTYHEGDADPTRFIMDSLPAGTHTLAFSWVVTKKQGKLVKHAHDFLTSYNFSGAVVAGVDPCLPRVQGGGNGPNVCTLGSAPDS